MTSTVQLQLQSRPESVAVVRAMLAGTSERLELGAELLADLKTAVSEACNNVVMHAYRNGAGPLDVGLSAHAGGIEITVTDRGCGMDCAKSGNEGSFGVGIPVIRALSAEAEFVSAPGGGTEVRMLFARGGAGRAHRAGAGAAAAMSTAPVEGVEGDVVLSVSPVSRLAGILARIAGCIAAEAHFSIDRYSDLCLITDGLAAHARSHASSPAISAGLAAQPRKVDLTVGPLRAGTSMLLAPGRDHPSPMVLSLLVDEVQIDSADGSEALRLMLADRRDDERRLQPN